MDDGWSQVIAFCARVQTIVWVIWAGVGVLTIALFILMWTRWGKTRLTHKCIVLSLFAHVLLFTYAGTAKIIGAPGPLGRDGAPGDVGDHPTVLVTEVQIGGEAEAKAHARAAAAKPWQTTPLRATPPPLPAGPERTEVELASTPQRSPSETPSLDSRQAEAEPLSPRSPLAPRSEATSADHLTPAETHPTVGAPQPILQSTPRVMPSAPGDLPRERLPSDAPTLTRQMSQTSDSLLQPQSRGQSTEEPRPLSAVDRSLAAKAKTPSIAEAGAPAADGAPTEEPGSGPQARSADAARSATAGPAKALTEANSQRPQPTHEPQPTTAVDSGAPRRHDLPQAYGHRARTDRQNIVTKQGGSPDTEAAVKAALAWLAANQEPAGHWDAAKHGAAWTRADGGVDARGNMRSETGVTGLALLAFLGAGHTHQGQQYQDNVKRGLDSLLAAQAQDGNLSGNATYYAAMYCHGMAMLALAEAYGMTGDARLLAPLRRAVAYTLAAQSPHHGGWRYLSKAPWGDTSQFGWQVMALKAAEMAGVEIPVANRHGMLRFLEYVSLGRSGGLACYLCRIQQDGTRILDAPTPTMTAEALFCRFLLGTTADNPLCQEAADYLLQNPPDERTDYYYWYYGTLSLYQLQGPAWETWNRAVQQRILSLQKSNGSWDANDRWGGHGGRVFTTALATLTLEVYYRYAPAGGDKVTR